MSNINEFRVGNFVNHNSPLGQHDFAEIVEIEGEGNGALYHMRHRKQPNGFVGYDDQIQGIIFRPEHVLPLGFHQNAQTGLYQMMHHAIAYEGYTAAGQEGQPVHHFPSMRIFKPMTYVPQVQGQQINLQEFQKNTVVLVYVNSLQNYFADQNIQFNFAPLSQFQNQY